MRVIKLFVVVLGLGSQPMLYNYACTIDERTKLLSHASKRP